jgi:hypothetical protein
LRSLGDEKVAPRDSVELDLREIISIFYDVRCQTVHEGITYDFHFSDDGKTWMMNWVDVSKPHEAPDIRVFKTRLTPAAPDQASPGANRGALGSEIGSGQQGSTANTPGG